MPPALFSLQAMSQNRRPQSSLLAANHVIFAQIGHKATLTATAQSNRKDLFLIFSIC
jgi:hypothetical protein